VCGPRAVRADMVERLSDLIRDRVFWKPRIPEEQRPAGSVDGGGFTVIPDMMSLVGCSGDEFSAILTSLGFRSQVRMLPKATTPGAKGAILPVAVEAASDVVADVAVDVETIVVEPVVTAAPPEELVETAVWWPKDMGPFRAQRPKPEPRPQQPRVEGEARGDGPRRGKPAFDKNKAKSRGPRPDKRSDAPRDPPKKFEKPADPNSPFAVLSALKAKFEKGDS
jgi:ATP-dependent RNA helicase SUPV3L1/SUV3